MELKQAVRLFMKAEDCKVKAADVNKITRMIARKIKEAQRTGNTHKIKICWTTLFQSFLEENLPLEHLDPFLEYLSDHFEDIRREFELGKRIADHLIDNLQIGGQFNLVQNDLHSTSLQLEHGVCPHTLARALGNTLH